MLTVGVVFGGCSVEHEISILSAIQVMAALKISNTHVVPIYITKDNEFTTGKNMDQLETFQKGPKKKKVRFEKNILRVGLKKTKIDCILSCVHGKGVEGGEVAGFFEMMKIPYSAIGVMGASLAQDKIHFKNIARVYRLPIIPYVGFTRSEWTKDKQRVKDEIKSLKFPLIVKPSMLGSSIGIERVKKGEDLNEAVLKVLQYDDRVLVEEMLSNYTEYNCAIVNDDLVSEIEEMKTSNDVLTFSDKYEGSKQATRTIPASIEEELKEEIVAHTKKIACLLGNKGVIRIDYLYDLETKKLYVNEANTIPGSLAHYLFEAKGISFEDLLMKMISFAIKDHHFKQQLIQSFQSNVLQMKGIKK